MADTNDKLRAWFEQLSQPAALIDSKGHLLYCNKAFQAFFAAETTAIPQTLWQLIETEDGQKPTVQSLIEEKKVWHKMASKPNASLKLYPTEDQENILALAIVESIATNDIEWLRRTAEEAHESNRLKSTFLANMSHEIRTPLNTIIGFSDLILEEALSRQEVLDLVEMIQTSGKTLLQLVEDIIDISRIEAGQVRINRTEVKVEAIFHELLQTFSYEHIKRRGKTGVELRCGNTQSTEACIYTDPYRFRQIMINLISNALKFTETGYIEFGYRFGVQGMIQFYVKDTGIGIDRLMSSKVFQRFGQIHQAGTQNASGAGLGMAITKELVELLGGQIWFDSQPGMGTTFYFTLPACKPSLSAPSDLGGNRYEWSKEIFLIVDDVESNYLYMRSLLRTTGALLLWAKDGEEAIRYCRSNPDISLVLMDVQMPKTDGYEATRRIKEINRKLPIIAQTAFVDENSNRLALEAGCDDFLTKPINKYELFSMIAKYLRK